MKPAADAAAGAPVTAGRVWALVLAMRPRQWVKNVLVFAAPFVGGQILQLDILTPALIAFGSFCLAASGVYLVNDVQDVESDRAHPTKRRRPIAAGLVAPPAAIALAVLLLLAGLALAALATPQLVIVLAVYEAVQLAYCFGLKRQPVIDICIVASGFLIRAVAGGAATGIPLSQWFLLSAGFGSLFMVSGKRYAEFQMAERTGAKIRQSLEGYSASFLRFVWGLAATVLVTTYGLWSFEIRTAHQSVWSALSMVPFVIAILRYAVDVDSGTAGEPEDIALSDRVLQVLAAAWVGMLVLAVYV